MEYQELKQVIEANDAATAITALKKGRLDVLPTTEKFLKEADPMRHDVMDTRIRPDKKVKKDSGDDNDEVFDANGNPIKGNFKIVKVERIALALQRLVVERAVSFAFGTPAEYVADVADDNEQAALSALLSVLKDVKIKSHDRKIARSMFTTTEVAECWYPREGKNKKYGFDSDFRLKVSVFSPLKGDVLYPFFDDNGDMIAFSREYKTTDANNVEHRHFETYTAEYTYRWTLGTSGWALDGEPVEQVLGKIPVVYGSQEEVEWAAVQTIIDRLETLLSNFADTNDYHASPKIFVTGQIHGWSEKGDSGAVIEGDEGSTMNYVSWQQAPEAIRLEIDTLLKMLYTITQTPDISFDNVKGVSAISGVALKMLFMDAHLKVQTKGEVLDEYLQRRTSIILKYLSLMNAKDSAFVSGCESIIIEPELVPYMIDDDSSLVNMLGAATGQKAIMSRETAVRRLGFVTDVDAEMKAIEADDGGAMMEDVFGQEPYNVNPQGNARAASSDAEGLTKNAKE